jgi:hypothetical protein
VSISVVGHDTARSERSVLLIQTIKPIRDSDLIVIELEGWRKGERGEKRVRM